MTAPVLADEAVRQRLRTELDRTFFVEAGAGTGKTTALVQRIVALVAAGRVRMDTLAAITFTEAAAAELRDRVRQGLEQGAQETQDPVERGRCAAAAGEVDIAAIQTIHAFAGSLLRTFPLEAGLPPGFATLDAIQQGLQFEERFRAWLYDEAVREEQPARRAAVRRALALGMTPDRMRDLARALQEQYDLLTADTLWASSQPPDPLPIAHLWGRELLALHQLVPLARNGESDPLVREILRMQFTAQRMAKAQDGDEALAALQALLVRKPSQRGSQAAWDHDGQGAHPVARCKATFKDAVRAAEEVVGAHTSAALVGLLAHLRDFTLAYAAERKRLGVATFHDLLTWARNLLRDNPGVRRRAAEQFERVFVDEFQDTDPLQAEIAWLLAAQPTQAEEVDWRKLTLVPGKLFLVGDPKQSIYRFRRADIGTFQRVYAGLDDPSGRVALVQNFRSVPAVVGWVNYQLARDMQPQTGVQAPYLDLAARPERADADVDSALSGVWRMGGPVTGGAPARDREEAAAVARLARQAVAQGWPVLDGNVVRAARYGDICVLLPSRGNLRRLERQFERLDVPYRMESGSLVLNTQEVRDLLACLRSIDDPSDQVALVAALRSPAYACSDPDLVRWVEAGGAFDYERQGSAARSCEGPVREAFDSLRSFHQARLDCSAAATMERFIRERMLAVQAFGHPRPRDAWRRLRYLVTRARTLAASGRPTLRALVDWLEDLQQTSYYDPESPTPETDEDAVRLMTIHGSKGLEFPIVLLTGLGVALNRRPPNPVHLIVDHGRGAIEVRCGAFRTPGYDAEREKMLDDAERVRLLYVAATRAREHLVLSLFHGTDPCHASRILQSLEESTDDLCREALLTEESPAVPTTGVQPALEPVPTAEEHAADEETWLARRNDQIIRLANHRFFTPSGLSNHLDDPPAGSEEREEVPSTSDDNLELAHVLRGGRGGTAVGSAVHAVLQTVDLASLADVGPLAEIAARAHGVPDRATEVERLARAAASSQPVQRALQGGRYWREVPVGMSLEDGLLEGAIDLLYEHSDGTLGIVDYKTDRLAEAELGRRAAHYQLQAAAYVLAIEQATDKQVSSVELVFADQGGRCVRYSRDDIAAATEQARQLVRHASR